MICRCELRILKDGDTSEMHVALRRPVLALYTQYPGKLALDLKQINIDPLEIFHDAMTIECKHFGFQLDGWEVKNDIPKHLIGFIEQFKRDPPTHEELQNKLGPIYNKMRIFQREALQFALSLDSFYNAAEMGLGKTLVYLASAMYRRQHWPVLCFTPAQVRATLRNEIHNWLGEDIRVFIVQKAKQLEHLPPYDFLILSYNMLAMPNIAQKLIQLNFKMALLDEAHMIKTRDAKRTVSMIQVLKPIPYKTLMSGTPGSSPHELYSQIMVLYPDLFPLFFSGNEREFQYSRRYCNPKQVKSGGRTLWEHNGCENELELSAVLCTFLQRIRKEEVMKSLPPKIRKCVILEELSKEQYDEIEQDKKPKKRKKEEVESKDFSFMANYRLTAQFKQDHVVKFLYDTLIMDLFINDPTIHVLIFVHHSPMREACKKLMDDNGISNIMIYGETPQKQREKNQTIFQNGEARCGILSITACGTGLTLTRASLVIFPELWFTPDVMMQAEDRAHRLGQTRSVDIWYLITPKTTDEALWILISKKQERMTSMIEGQPRELKAGRCGHRQLDCSSGFSREEPQIKKLNVPKLNLPKLSLVKEPEWEEWVDDDSVRWAVRLPTLKKNP